jgi:shikimate kinase
MVQNIILTGFMGTGKTTVGLLLAERLDYSFIDTDELIEKRHGRSIPTIFAESGETAFRQMEREGRWSWRGGAGWLFRRGGG